MFSTPIPRPPSRVGEKARGCCAAFLLWLGGLTAQSQTPLQSPPSSTLVASGIGDISSQGASFNDQWLVIVAQETSGSRVRAYNTPASGSETLRWQWPPSGDSTPPPRSKFR